MSTDSRGMGEHKMEHVNPLCPHAWAGSPVSAFLRGRAWRVYSLSQPRAPALRATAQCWETTHLVASWWWWWGCSQHMGPQHLQDPVIVDACCGRGGTVLSQEVCPSGPLEPANDHIPSLEVDALIVSTLSAEFLCSGWYQSCAGRDGDRGWNPGSVPGCLVVL